MVVFQPAMLVYQRVPRYKSKFAHTCGRIQAKPPMTGSLSQSDAANYRGPKREYQSGGKFPKGKQIMTWTTYPTIGGQTILWKTSNEFEFKQKIGPTKTNNRNL